MTKPLDSNLYGDIYGDDDNEFVVALQEADNEVEQEPSSKTGVDNESLISSKPEGHSYQASPTAKQDPHLSLPPKPISSGSALSYSAQIAQQFSVYQQTPSQERQQRPEIPLPPHPRTLTSGQSAIATHEGSINTPCPSDSIFGKKPSEMHDAGKMFIGGLNWDTTDEGLRNYFSEFGKVDACTIMRDPSGTSRGFAFLTFEDPASVNAVVVREHYLDGKGIDPKRAIPREEHLRNTRYFVGGLSPSTSSDSMREFFAAFGKVVDATVMVDRESGRSKGFGFVTFEDASNADQLVGKIGLIMDDKQIEVKMAQPRSQRDQSRNMNNGNNSSNNIREPFFNDRESRTPPTAMSFPSQQPNQVSMIYQRSMGQVPIMGGALPMINMNPMAMAMGMGMNGYNHMAGVNGMNMMGMNGMNALSGMNGMNEMNVMNGLNGLNGLNGMTGNLNGMGNFGTLRLGMGPMGGVGLAPGGIGSPAVGGPVSGVTMRPGMGGIGAVNTNFNRMATNVGPGPSRISNRGQHSFHPYSR